LGCGNDPLSEQWDARADVTRLGNLAEENFRLARIYGVVGSAAAADGLQGSFGAKGRHLRMTGIRVSFHKRPESVASFPRPEGVLTITREFSKNAVQRPG
jgi:hypothetical protein